MRSVWAGAVPVLYRDLAEPDNEQARLIVRGLDDEHPGEPPRDQFLVDVGLRCEDAAPLNSRSSLRRAVTSSD